MKISLLVIRCQDIEASKHFYKKLGLVFKQEKHGSGPEHYSCDYDGMVFELYPNKGEAPNDNVRLGFHLDDLDDKVKRLEVVGSYEMHGQVVYIVTDPDGRKIELSRLFS